MRDELLLTWGAGCRGRCSARGGDGLLGDSHRAAARLWPAAATCLQPQPVRQAVAGVDRQHMPIYLLDHDYVNTVASAQRWCLRIMSQTLRILRAYSGQILNLYLMILSAFTDPRYEAYLI